MTDTCGRSKRDGSGDSCSLPAGWGTEHVGEGACKLHGGNTGRGKDNPNYKHGAYSKFAEYDDDVLDAVDAMTAEGDIAVLEDLRAERLSQYYTVLQYYAQSEGVQVAQDVLDAIESGEQVDKGLVGELARVMQVSTKSMDNLIARVQSLTNDIADRKGDAPRTVAEEHRLDDDQLERLGASIENAYGDA